MSSPGKVRIEGKVTSGKKEAKHFVKLIEEQIEQKFGFKPYLGTLNIEVQRNEDKEALKLMKDLSAEGIKVTSPHSGCFGTCFYATVNDEVDTVVVLPHVERYHSNVIELISPMELKRELKLKDGDTVKVEITLPERRIKAALIDMDNTLLDTFKLYSFSFNKALAEFGLNEVQEEVLKSKLNLGLSLGEILKDIISGSKKNIFLEKIISRIRTIYLDYEDEYVKPINGVVEALEKLKNAGVIIVLATGSMMSKVEIRKRLMKFGLDKYITYIISGEDVKERKPSPEIVLKVIRMLKLYPRECLVIGDSIADIKAGKAAVTLTAAVLTGVGNKEDFMKERPDFIAKDLLELINNLIQLKYL
jgi:phosphoglycolate phosphatase